MWDTRKIKYEIKKPIDAIFNYHEKDDNSQDILISTITRSGSNWLMEMIYKEDGVKYTNQPLWRISDMGNNPELPRQKCGRYFDIDEKGVDRIVDYLNNIFRGSISVRPPWNIFSKSYNFKTNRYVAKTVTTTNIIDKIQKRSNFIVVYLVRHPIARSISKMKKGWSQSCKVYLESESFLRQYVGSYEINEIKSIVRCGDDLEKYVLEWCLDNIVPLSCNGSCPWLMLTYEDMVLQYKSVVKKLSSFLNLRSRKYIENKGQELSRSASKKLSRVGSVKRTNALGKWNNDITNKKERKVMEVLELFNFDIYEYGSNEPKSDYRIKE